MRVGQWRITKRIVEEGDARLVERIFESSRELERAVGQWSEVEWKDFVRVQCNAQRAHYGTMFPNATHEIVLVDARSAGRIWIDRSPNEIRLLDITLLPEFRCQGFGSALIQELQKEAQAGKRPLRHMVERDNPRAMRLYARLGFRIVSEHSMHYLMEWIGERLD